VPSAGVPNLDNLHLVEQEMIAMDKEYSISIIFTKISSFCTYSKHSKE
jgi:hypothetical protein